MQRSQVASAATLNSVIQKLMLAEQVRSLANNHQTEHALGLAVFVSAG